MDKCEEEVDEPSGGEATDEEQCVEVVHRLMTLTFVACIVGCHAAN